MTLEAYLAAVLLADAEIAAVVADRVLADSLPQQPPGPCVILHLVSAPPTDHSLSAPTGVRAVTFQVDAWASTRAIAISVAAAARRVLDGHTGAAGGLEVQGVFHVGERVDRDEDAKLSRASTDYEVWYSA
jgi:hypothetical protein